MSESLSLTGQCDFAKPLLLHHHGSDMTLHHGSDMTLPIIIAAVTTLLVLCIGGWMTTIGPWYKNLRKPMSNPPNCVFGPAWTVILGLAAWSNVLAWMNASTKTEQLRVIALFGINIFLHMLWSPLFFNFRRPDWALAEISFLWLSIIGLMFGLAPLSLTCVWLLLPYALWVTFAAFLNLTIVRMNRPFGAWQYGQSL
jgi:translocator protein